jgi:predicted RNA binding protein YcfA (HicA-like mRNA interferase family)
VPKYRELPPERVIAALQKLGFYARRQRGSHVIMRRDDPFAQRVVPRHARVKPIILMEILRQAGVSLEAFLKLT